MKVSVVVPLFNRADLIGATLANLLRQSLPPHEIIVVDDGSTDGSADVVRSFGNRVLLLAQPNRGPGAARNAGILRASGDFIQFQDSDDLLSLNKIESQVRLLERTGAEFAYGPMAKGRIKDRTLILDDCVLHQAPLPDELPFSAWILRGLAFAFQACLIRRSVLDRAGFYREDLMPSEDSELLFRISNLLSRSSVVLTWLI